MGTWREAAKEEVRLDLETQTRQIAQLREDLRNGEKYYLKLCKQLTCKHEMEVSINGGCFGGSDIEKCKHCDYEWVF